MYAFFISLIEFSLYRFFFAETQKRLSKENRKNHLKQTKLSTIQTKIEKFYGGRYLMK